MASQLSRAINERVIRRLAGDAYYRRGQDYYLHGHVGTLEGDGNAVRALVRGTRIYTVELTAEGGMVDYSCDCPLGIEGAFCKHCVAVALAWMNPSGDSASPRRRGKENQVTLADAEKSLMAEEKESIVRNLIAWAKKDSQLRERLMMYAARRAGPAASLAAVQKAFTKALQVHEFVHYREMPSYAFGVGEAIDSIETLLQDGQAAGVMELCESCLASLTRQMEMVDDSDGYMGGLLERLQDIHYRACLESRPEPEALARRLFHWALHGNYDVFLGAVSRYGEILGPQGMKCFRELAEKEWAKVSVKTPANRGTEWGKHFRITHIMEDLARASGDLEALVGVLSRDLSSAYKHLRIAEAYGEAGQHDKALEWAERALKDFPGRPDYRLAEFLANEYHRRKRHEEAMSLIWSGFGESATLEAYKTLEKHARKAGNWPAWRERALAEVRSRIGGPDHSDNWVGFRRAKPKGDRSRLVEIFLYEGDVDAAWCEAQAGGCGSELWLELARLREENHPEDAARIYLEQADVAVRTATKSVYDDSVQLLVKAAALMKRLGRSAEFVQQLDSLRTKYKLKRNFLKLLEEKKRLLYSS